MLELLLRVVVAVLAVLAVLSVLLVRVVLVLVVVVLVVVVLVVVRVPVTLLHLVDGWAVRVWLASLPARLSHCKLCVHSLVVVVVVVLLLLMMMTLFVAWLRLVHRCLLLVPSCVFVCLLLRLAVSTLLASSALPIWFYGLVLNLKKIHRHTWSSAGCS